MARQIVLISLLVVAASACDYTTGGLIGGNLGCNNVGLNGGLFGLSGGLLGLSNVGISGGVLGYNNIGLNNGVLGLNNVGISGSLPIDLIGSGSYLGGCSSLGSLSGISGPSVVASEVLSNKCDCVQTIVRPKQIKQVVNVPTRRVYTQTFTQPKIETITYRARPVSSGVSSLASLGVADLGYPQVDLLGGASLGSPLLSSLGATLGSSCLPSLPISPCLPTC